VIAADPTLPSTGPVTEAAAVVIPVGIRPVSDEPAGLKATVALVLIATVPRWRICATAALVRPPRRRIAAAP
jgi:hypothetical protein